MFLSGTVLTDLKNALFVRLCLYDARRATRIRVGLVMKKHPSQRFQAPSTILTDVLLKEVFGRDLPAKKGYCRATDIRIAAR